MHYTAVVGQRCPAALAGQSGDLEMMMINVTFKLKSAKKTASGVLVKLAGDDAFEWRLADQPHPLQPAGCVTLWHWCSGSYRWLDEGAVDALLAVQ